MFAAANHLDRLLVLVDYNGIQAVGRSDEIMGHTSLEEKFKAFGWAARTINGNDMGEIIRTLDQVPFQNGRPSAMIAKSKGGAGVSFMEDKVLWHYRVPSDEELAQALEELGERTPTRIEPSGGLWLTPLAGLLRQILESCCSPGTWDLRFLTTSRDCTAPVT